MSGPGHSMVLVLRHRLLGALVIGPLLRDSKIMRIVLLKALSVSLSLSVSVDFSYDIHIYIYVCMYMTCVYLDRLLLNAQFTT